MDVTKIYIQTWRRKTKRRDNKIFKMIATKCKKCQQIGYCVCRFSAKIVKTEDIKELKQILYEYSGYSFDRILKEWSDNLSVYSQIND